MSMYQIKTCHDPENSKADSHVSDNIKYGIRNTQHSVKMQ